VPNSTKTQRKKGKRDGETPAMRQFHAFKKQHPDCVLFFRMGDFYEMFHDDAKLAHKVLGVTLTQRSEGVPMAGVPYHSVEGYLRRMIQAGYRVAVCDQMEDAAQAKGVVRRDVTRVITPGTLTDDSLMDEGQENPLAAVVLTEGKAAAAGAAHVAWVEMSTGAFRVATFGADELADELARIGPRELLYVEQDDGPPSAATALADQLKCVATARPAWQFRRDEAVETLCKQFRVRQLDGFGLSAADPLIGPASAIVHYLLETQRTSTTFDENMPASLGGRKDLGHLRPPRRFERSAHLVIDQTSLRSLEIDKTLRSQSSEGSVLGVLQDCVTAMGKRMLRQWLCYPLRDRAAIEARQRVVEAMVHDSRLLDDLRSHLDGVQDIERIMSRLSVGRASPRDVAALGRSAQQALRLTVLLAERPALAAQHATLSDISAPLAELAQQIAGACVDDPPAHLRDGGLIRDGYDGQLDECRELQRDSRTWLANYQKQLIEKHELNTLKVGYNKVFGYYIELTAVNAPKAPDGWTRKQTLKNAERFITEELKEFEDKVLSAESRGVAREQQLFKTLCDEAAEHLDRLHTLAQTVAQLDVLACFARRAARCRYVKPTIVDEPLLQIEAGRHPVLDELLGEQFVPNDVRLGNGGRDGNVGDSDTPDIPVTPATPATNGTLALITGPNMAGKSTYIRQTALIALLAHTGSYVPATSATVGLTDRIFTRIGASDELHTGQSTFMVEMTETANICHHATEHSLVILDEIGRGTSTLDGLSLAWAIAEHLAGRRCRTLFATHYHELTQLAEQFDNVANLNVTVREWQDEIVFLHRIAPGATNRSYGIHVAKIAGLPDEVVRRADELLGMLEVSHAGDLKTAAAPPRDPSSQMSLFTEYVDHPLIERLRSLDLNALSPIEAFDLLRKWRDELK